MKSQIIRTLALSSLTALNIVSAAHGGMLPIEEAREKRLGGIVAHADTNEELFLGCVEDNDAGVCIQYRFITQLGDAPRVLGDQPVEPYKHSSENLVDPTHFFEGKKILPALSWMGEGFEVNYGPDRNREVKVTQDLQILEPGNELFTSCFPMVGLPGVGSVVLAGSVAYDTTRLLLLTPVETVRTTVKNFRIKKLNRAFSVLFDARKKNTSETHTLDAKPYKQLKDGVITLSTAQPAATN